ncbi:MAG: hypothetical protein M3Z37_08825 [Candidatus Eremiobacteraeota bacterium]|nr:hypothetical protein [Candidatus Eremiobacteraeota bacterium]
MSMRIVWGSPWNERSAIAAFGVAVVEELLARGHQVEVLRTELGAAAKLSSRPSSARVRFWGDIALSEFSRNADVVIGNFGNHYPFHGALLENFSAVGIVGIFHDCVLSHLAEGWANASPNPALMLRRLVLATYGASAWPGDEPFIPDFATAARQRPMLEWFASGVTGAVAHAQHYAERLRAVCPGPVAVIALPFAADDLPPAPQPRQDEMVVATIGMGISNKRMGQVMEAVAGSPRLRAHCRFRAIGEADPDEQADLAKLSERLGVEAPAFTGWVSDEGLRAQLRDVDVLSCLRHPVLEGASASLLLSMLSARPVLVSHQAVYAELPQGLVLPCAPGDEAADVRRHLEWVMDHRLQARAMGERARAYVQRTNTAARYVDALLPLLDAAVAARPGVLAAQALGKTLASFSLAPADPSVERVAKTLAGLLGR